MTDVENSESGDMGFRDAPEYSDYELDSLSEKERVLDPGNMTSPSNENGSGSGGGQAPQPLMLWDTKMFSSKASELEKILKQVNGRLDKEHQNTIMQGGLERKTTQQMFGKKLWEHRYFKLSTHYLSAYRNENDTQPEQQWRIASICWIYLCVEKASGTRFNVYFDNDTLQLRGQNLTLCQHWVTKLGDAKKRHRNGLRENLQQLGIFEKAMNIYHAQAKMKRNIEIPKAKEEVKKADKDTDNKGKNKEKTAKTPNTVQRERKLDLYNWAIDSDDFTTETSLSQSVTFVEGDKVPLPEEEKKDEDKSSTKKKLVIRPHLTRTISCSGFLIFARESVEKDAAVVGKKKEYYFTLEKDVLEYKNTPTETVNIGILALDRIESVYRDSSNKEEWRVTFVNNTIMKWLFELPFNSNESNKKWIGLLKRGSKEARAVKWTIIREYKWSGGIVKSGKNGTVEMDENEQRLAQQKWDCTKRLMDCFMPEDWDKKTSSRNSVANEDSINEDELGTHVKSASEQGKRNCCIS